MPGRTSDAAEPSAIVVRRGLGLADVALLLGLVSVWAAGVATHSPNLVAAGGALVAALAAVALFRRRARLRRVLERLLRLSHVQVGDAVLARGLGLIEGLELVAGAASAQVQRLSGRLQKLQGDDDRLRRVLGSVAPASFTYRLAGVDIAGVGVARGRLGGDWSLIRRLDRDHVLVAVGDVTGHDAASAYVAAALSGALRVMPAERVVGAPERVLAQLTDLVDELSERRLTSSCVLIVVDVAERRMQIVNAGHPAPWLVRDGAVARSLPATGAPLGMGQRTAPRRVVLELEPWDRLVAFTDGLVEQADSRGRVVGPRRLFALLQKRLAREPLATGSALVGGVLDGFRELTGGAVAADDLTFLVCTLTPEAFSLVAVGDEEPETDVSHPALTDERLRH
jgi:serine phosphatase RsbU (regulator of sigma subunit)